MHKPPYSKIQSDYATLGSQRTESFLQLGGPREVSWKKVDVD